jgi:hypothetical protein
MNEPTNEPVLLFPEWYDERAEYETPLKGFFEHAVVQAGGGSRYAVTFFDPVRLQQDLSELVKLGTPYVAEPGLIVLPEVTTDAMRAAVKDLWRNGYFEQLQPLPHKSGAQLPVGKVSA